jgi:FtsP/CotA-like multicopper oxidase with cupredoxin domain
MHYCEGITVGETVVLNATEDWTFSNTTGDFHPMHMHLMQFQVVSGGQNLMDCNGVPVKAMKDTVSVPPGGTVTVRAKFSPYKGEYVYHCHILEHEDMGMMRTLKVI